MKNSHNLTGLLAESLVWLLLLVKDCWKSCFIGKTPTLYVFFRHHLRQDKNTFNARVLANVSEFFHHLVLQEEEPVLSSHSKRLREKTAVRFLDVADEEGCSPEQLAKGALLDKDVSDETFRRIFASLECLDLH